MPKLHLVAITPDHKGLVLSEHANSKRGDLVLDIDDRLLDAIEKAQRLRARAEGSQLESAALPSKRVPTAADDARLTPREIQQRLRAGESVAAIAKAAGVEVASVDRFAAPVLAEIQTVVDKAKTATYSKRGAGPSAVPLAPSVASNILERGADISVVEIEDSWSAHVRPDGGWSITFSFPAKGRKQKAEWSFDPDTGEVSSRNKLAAELGYRDPGGRSTKPPASPKSSKPAVEEVVDAALDDGAQTLPGTDVGPELSGTDLSGADLSDTDDLPAFTRRPPTARKAPPRKAATGKPSGSGGPAFPGAPPGFEPEVADADPEDYGEPEIAGEDDDDDGIPVLSVDDFLADEPEPPAQPEPPFPTFPDDSAVAAPFEATPESPLPDAENG